MGEAIRPRLAETDGLICEKIEAHFGSVVSSVRQQVDAIGVPQEMAEALAVRAGSHALELRRWYLDRDGNVFEVSVSVHPAGRFSHAMEMRRRGLG